MDYILCFHSFKWAIEVLHSSRIEKLFTRFSRSHWLVLVLVCKRLLERIDNECTRTTPKSCNVILFFSSQLQFKVPKSSSAAAAAFPISRSRFSSSGEWIYRLFVFRIILYRGNFMHNRCMVWNCSWFFTYFLIALVFTHTRTHSVLDTHARACTLHFWIWCAFWWDSASMP